VYPIYPGPSHTPSHTSTSGHSDDSDSWVVPVVIFSGLGSLLVLALGLGAWANRVVANVRIVRTPPGEAPEAIRRAWVGVELPLRQGETKAGPHLTVGVLSQQGAETMMAGSGYAVDGRAAVQALAAHSPEAAAWWREHAPHVLEPGYRLWFPREVCERVG
jgi:hypothetical protein